ncbi:unnamed protein product [Adineta ricciae]|uniref:Uncharacterized protein n=1 Tax=Adineta ricciae TaxID=249248 RepID=A0A814YVC8_ADIRI|nr:unnamed protein product [Adineta ricciae]CAF1595383.1 unnamed protein product [Adineta ricciae]
MLAIIDEKHSKQSSIVDVYYPLESMDICLKVHYLEKSNPCKIEIEIRNRQREQSLTSVQHWSIFQMKFPQVNLPDKILTRLDEITSEKISKYLQMIVNEEYNRLEYIQIEKTSTVWQMDDSDRELEQSDIQLTLMKGNEPNEVFYIPKYWRTIAIQTGDYEKLVKTLTTLQIEDNRDLLDYFSYLISQTRLNSFSLQNQQQLGNSNLSSEKAYMNLLTMSYAAFIELIQRIQKNNQS